MVQSKPLARRYFSAANFSSKAPPKALVATNPGLFSCPQARPSVKILETITTFFTPAFLAASINLMVPRLSTSWAAADSRSKFFPGFIPQAIINPSAPSKVALKASTESSTTSKCFKSPLIAFEAFSTFRTPPIVGTPALTNRSKTRLPVCPVAPATTTFCMSAAKAAGGVTKEEAEMAAPATIAVWNSPRRDTTASALSSEDIASAEAEKAGEGVRRQTENAEALAARLKRNVETHFIFGFGAYVVGSLN